MLSGVKHAMFNSYCNLCEAARTGIWEMDAYGTRTSVVFYGCLRWQQLILPSQKRHNNVQCFKVSDAQRINRKNSSQRLPTNCSLHALMCVSERVRMYRANCTRATPYKG